ncbi:PREDICTED: diphosphomevalonate decarboxylase [Ceratosolen solmsi marchali]|uniref:Diphosphomevalonate decarboxylase n=1 Tax=Ceratosolen solmsi marchali TaxID=326594 RepID=A0AAJ6YG60_9HYME|nr:PREDICTED: diphosphomevalonate decarboxylase [Ceratosolen solmsi marchali]
MNVVTCIAPINIAVIKYWGKRDDDLILPVNDSISTTLDKDHLCTKTTAMASSDFKEDRMWLNGSEQSMDNPRLQNCLRELKKRAQISEEMQNWKLHICSENNFPTAAGLASSAAGYACLVTTIAKLYKVEGEVSELARVGSGSACRSMYGGFVRWFMGSDPKGSDSIAKPIVPVSHWPDMRILILVINDSQKKVSSAQGMKRTLMTSELIKYRIDKILPTKINQMQQAILNKDFESFAELTMKDSNQMHAVCLDTYPPCIYMNDTSHLIVDLIHSYNATSSKIKVAYTFDAGPNATLFLLEKDVPEFVSVLDHYFPSIENINIEYKKGIAIETILPSKNLLEKINFTKQTAGKLKYIIHTRIGNGPEQLSDCKSHLLNSQGLPVASLITNC